MLRHATIESMHVESRIVEALTMLWKDSVGFQVKRGEWWDETCV